MSNPKFEQNNILGGSANNPIYITGSLSMSSSVGASVEVSNSGSFSVIVLNSASIGTGGGGNVVVANSASLYIANSGSFSVVVLNSGSFPTSSVVTIANSASLTLSQPQVNTQPARMFMSNSFQLSGSSLVNLYGYHTINGLRFVHLFFTGTKPTDGEVPAISIPISGAYNTFNADYTDLGGLTGSANTWVVLSSNSSSLSTVATFDLTIKGIMKS